jgi:hypothetical protein
MAGGRHMIHIPYKICSEVYNLSQYKVQAYDSAVMEVKQKAHELY